MEGVEPPRSFQWMRAYFKVNPKSLQKLQELKLILLMRHCKNVFLEANILASIREMIQENELQGVHRNR